MGSSRPESRGEFEVAIVCALPLEYDAVTLLIDEFWDENGDIYGRAIGDNNTYTTGRVGNHNVVVALLPGMGKLHAAFAVAGLRSSYTNINLALVTGICGGVPRAGTINEILLGDVIISETIVQYDFGRQYPSGFTTKLNVQDSFGRSNADMRGLLAVLRTEMGFQRLQQRASFFLQTIHSKAAMMGRPSHYSYPGTHADRLFDPGYVHKHYGPSECACSRWVDLTDPVCEDAATSPYAATGCSTDQLLPRRRLRMRQALEGQSIGTNVQEPLILLGPVASGDNVMKSATDRDPIAEAHKVIAFEMEGPGAWDKLPSLVIKGVCDYADSHKDNCWQMFAAATAAATVRAVLERYIQTDRVARMGQVGRSPQERSQQVLMIPLTSIGRRRLCKPL
ncbi:nucleoside phosphorylase domain-containing protein [Dactylonectria estremocensis]|uniref:Nucleoside phosphorylase domain-containing protein n=1 Tax=Dactylonectria estremocensis TaxID=1079267 RepID=A0A9P9EST0_9HYPO|nr:nucleoside phosphorylase domain-containing protein [Dactylonectria estremocensis]